MGARQVFIRALAPKLARNGVIVNELLLTEDQSNFEIAGHQFELIRNAKTNEPTSSSNPSASKLKFTLARPMEIGQIRQPTVAPAKAPPQAPTGAPTRAQASAPTQLFEQQQAFERSQARIDSSELQPQWITDLIQSAMLPLERQLNGIIEPLAAVQNELDKRAKQDRKRRSRSAKRIASERESSEQRLFEQGPTERSVADPSVGERSFAEHYAHEASFTTQIDVQPQIAHIPETVMVPIVSPEVEAQLARQSETLDKLNARLTEVKSNLGSLERIVSENFVTVIDAASAPTATPEPVNEALQKITSVSEQLQDLTTQMDHVKCNLGSLQQTVSENLATTNELRNTPEPASKEALDRLTEVANQLSALLQDMHARQISSEVSNQAMREELRAQEVSEVAWREQLRSQESSEVAWREQLREQIVELRDTVAATESSILNATETSLAKAQSAILAATESAVQKSSQLRQPVPKGTCPTSAALIANGHLQATVEVAPRTIRPAIQATAAPIAFAPVPEEVRSPVASPANVFSEPTFSEPAFSTPASSEANFTEPTFTEPKFESPVAEVAPLAFSPDVLGVKAEDSFEEELPPPASIRAVEIEQPNQFAQYVWNPEPTPLANAPAMEPITASDPVPFDNPWGVSPAPSQATAIDLTNTSANFIEETIEEIPSVEEATASALPSWWTDDDKTQFKDDTAASAAIASPWNVTSNFAEPKPVDWATESSDSRQDHSEGFATSADGFESASAWDVEAAYESAQLEPEVPASSQSSLVDFAALAATPSVEAASDASLKSDESSELSSLLQRFGIVREPDEQVEVAVPEVRKPILKAESQPTADEVAPAAKSAPSAFVADEESEAVMIDRTEVVRGDRDPIDLPEPVSAIPASTPPAESTEEESIEDYMKRLMARMRGGSVEEEAKPSAPAPVIAPAPSVSADSMSASKLALPSSAATERAPISTTGPFDPEEYVPKALAPEKTRNMAAMRELANTSARSAIQVSARRRYGTAIALKLAIALIGVGVGVTLVMINGLNVNIGLIATIASFLVALIWGFDAFSTLKPLLYAGAEAGESVAVDETQESPQV